MAKSSKSKIVIGGLVAITVLNMLGTMIYNRFIKINNPDMEIKNGVVNFQISPNFLIKTHLGDDVKDPRSHRVNRKNLGDYPIGYKPLPLARLPNEKFMSVDRVDFNLILQKLPDAEPIDNKYHKNSVKVIMIPINAFQNSPKKEIIAKSKLNPKIAKIISDETNMDCKVRRSHSEHQEDRYRSVACVWEDEKKVLPDLYLNFPITVTNDGYELRLGGIQISHFFTFETSYKELGVDVKFSVKEEHFDQWPSIYSYIHELVYGFKAI